MATNFAIQKATVILEAIVNNPGTTNIGDLAYQLDLPRQTIHRIMQQLDEIGLVRRDPIRQCFIPGERLRKLCTSTLIYAYSDTAISLVLRELADKVQETCNVGVLEGHEVVYLNRVECNSPLRVNLQPGSRVPAYCTAIGKLLLAQIPEPQRLNLLCNLRLKSLTPNTLTNVEDLQHELSIIAGRGYSINDQEDTLGLIAIAVPIMDPEGRIIAGLAVHSPETRLPIAKAIKLLPLLNRTAARISNLYFDNKKNET
jgi:DNA-binding IclR family transcriptional regulator